MLSFDIQRTETTAALFDEHGTMRGLTRSPMPNTTSNVVGATVDQVEALTQRFSRDFPDVSPTAVGLIAPGIVDDDEGIAVLSADLRWANVPYRKLAEDRLRLPCSFSNDIRAAGAAEFELGAARPFKNVVVLRLGARIAASMYVHGQMYDGGGFAGGLGHSIVNPHGARCTCGSSGCLHTVASSGGLVERYAELTDSASDSVTSDEVLERARNGDTAANTVWGNALDALALVVSQISAVLAPEAVIVGGGLAQADEEFFEPLHKRVNCLLSFHRRPLLLPPLLDRNAGLIGAALRARALAA